MSDGVSKNHAIAAGVIGGLELLFGLIIIICSAVIASKVSVTVSLTPYWAGAPYLLPGIFGILLIWQRKLCLMVAFLVLNILTCIVQGIAFIIVAIVVAIYAAYADNNCKYRRGFGGNDGRCFCSYSGNSWDFETSSGNCDVTKEVSQLLYALVVFLALASIASFAGSIVGCIGSCCRGRKAPGVVLQTNFPSIPPSNYPNMQQPAPAYTPEYTHTPAYTTAYTHTQQQNHPGQRNAGYVGTKY